jgi:hypothetical protein
VPDELLKAQLLNDLRGEDPNNVLQKFQENELKAQIPQEN